MTSQAKLQPNWPALIKDARQTLNESQTQFGARFNVSHVSVSYWERGMTDAPLVVIDWLIARGALTRGAMNE